MRRETPTTQQMFVANEERGADNTADVLANDHPTLAESQ